MLRDGPPKIGTTEIGEIPFLAMRVIIIQNVESAEENCQSYRLDGNKNH